jgi:two-component system chemotaxis response regulator CheY
MKKRRGQPCSLVLSDLYTEPMDGLELLRIMRINESLKTIPFIMITASAQPDKVAEAKTLGANG